MAEMDSKKQFLSLIRNFATEKSQGERRIVGLKKRIDELQSELDSTNAELEEVKSLKETTERDLKGYEVELSINGASIHALEARVSKIQEEISVSSSKVEASKTEERALRDEFINKIYKLNADKRKFQAETAQVFSERDCIGSSTNNEGLEAVRAQAAEAHRNSLLQKIGDITSEIRSAQQEYQEAQNVHKKDQELLSVLQKKLFLIESIKKESVELQDMTRQTSEYEENCAFLGQELQRICVCPGCHQDNVETLAGLLQAGDEP